jgi:hypothetical protein
MSKRLEDFIRMHQGDFDDLEPRSEIWQQIEKKLPQKKPRSFSLGYVLRVAAIIIICMSVGFVIYIKKQAANQPLNLAAINPTYARQQVKYISLIETKQDELKNIAHDNPQLYKEFRLEIAKMDSVYQKLNKDLINSPNQDRVLRAMIRNLQVQIDVLNQQLNIIEQSNQFKKEQYEIENI